MMEQLTAEFPPISLTVQDGQYLPIAPFTNLKYTRIEATGFTLPAFCMEQSIDLNGLMLEEDTVLIPKAYAIQDPGIYFCQIDNADYTFLLGSVQTVEIMSTRKLDLQQVVDDLILKISVPGSLESPYDKQQIIMGEQRIMMPATPAYDPVTLTIGNTPGLLNLNRQSTFGYAAKIANPRVFCYRILMPRLDFDTPGLFTAPPLRIRMEVEVQKTSEIEYIYALKRNTELHQ